MPGLQASGRMKWAICLWVLSAPSGAIASAAYRTGTQHRGMGVSAMSEARDRSLLVEYFKAFIDDRDLDSFRCRVSSRYNEGTLGRILLASKDVAARRAAVLSLGIMGSFAQSNAVLGRALADLDPVVRRMTEDALWAVWFRADTAEHNQMLSNVAAAISRDELEQAEVLVTRLIASAPNFAEAYNQRAIIYFLQGRLAESVQDCERVLARNPYHFGAMSGMAESQKRLNRPEDVLKSLRRALKIRPHQADLREEIQLLEGPR